MESHSRSDADQNPFVKENDKFKTSSEDTPLLGIRRPRPSNANPGAARIKSLRQILHNAEFRCYFAYGFLGFSMAMTNLGLYCTFRKSSSTSSNWLPHLLINNFLAQVITLCSNCQF